MARASRLEFPGVPLHVRHRGVNRAACFFTEVDRRFYLKCLAQAAGRAGCAIHAYVLMPNHVHLLVTPSKAGATGRMMQDVGRRYVRVINNLHGRTGTLWEGRFKSSLVHDERYLMTVHRYIELNPVRAGLSAHPGSYGWSSHLHYSGSEANALITEHRSFLSLGRTATERRATFRDLLTEDIDAETLKKIRGAIETSSPIGVEVPKRGRPRKTDEGDAPEAPISGNLF